MQCAHSLSIGGTGMLAAATRALLARSQAVTVLARRPDRLVLSESESSRRISPIALDLTDKEAVVRALSQQID